MPRAKEVELVPLPIACGELGTHYIPTWRRVVSGALKGGRRIGKRWFIERPALDAEIRARTYARDQQSPTSKSAAQR